MTTRCGKTIQTIHPEWVDTRPVETWSIPAGATVYDVSGEKLGKVSGGIALGSYFRLEKGLIFPHEYYVPKSAISRIDPDGVYLNVSKDGVKNSGWDQRPTESVETLGHSEEPEEPHV